MMLRTPERTIGESVGPCPDIAVPPSQRPRVLRRGSMHPAVREAQRKLNVFHAQELAAGRPGLDRAPLVEDCMFGPKTHAAVIDFQRRVFPGQPNEHDGIIGPKTWAKLDLVGLLVPPAPPPVPVPVVPIPIPLPPSALCDAIVATAEGELRRWNPAGGALTETDPAATPILQQYYREGVNVAVSAADLQSAEFQSRNPWSAVFISWVMRTAGAGGTFVYSRAHQTYIRAARENRLRASVASPFWAFRATEVAPEPGDLVCTARAGSGATYDNIGDPTFRAAHCDVVTRVTPNELRAIGGNVSDRVASKRLRTGADGRLALDRNQSQYFAVVRCRGPIVTGPGVPATPPVVPSPPPPVVPAPPVGADARILRVMELLVDQYGYPVNGAAGLVGNLIAESGVIPNRVEGSAAATPMRARNFAGQVQDFTADEIMDRNRATGVGPRLPGVGLAQWTSPDRRRGLFRHAFNGQVLGAQILFSMEGQVDYLVTELGSRGFAPVDRVLRRPAVTVNDAADEVVYRFEVPGAILENGRPLPRSDPRVQAVFAVRRNLAQRALRVYRAAHP